MNTNTPPKVKGMAIAANLAALNDLMTTAAKRSAEAHELARTVDRGMQCGYRRDPRRGLYFGRRQGPVRRRCYAAPHKRTLTVRPLCARAPDAFAPGAPLNATGED
jgi:hypothetical protein